MHAFTEFDPADWELVIVEVRRDNGKFQSSGWERVLDGRRWRVVIGLNDSVETVIEVDRPLMAHPTEPAFYDFVERVNRELRLGRDDGPGA